MSRFLTWLIHRMELVGIRSQAELAEVSGIALRTISRIFDQQSLGKSERSTRAWLARTLKVSVRELERLDAGEIETIPDDRIFEWEHYAQGRDLSMSPSVSLVPVGAEERGIPVIGRVTAGGMVESYDDWDDETGRRLPLKLPGLEGVYALEICGDSMVPAYLPGEFVILRNIPLNRLKDGEDVMIQMDGDGNGKSTFKRVYIVGQGRLKLVSLNQNYEPFDIDSASVVRVGRLEGKFTPPRLISGK